MAPPKLRPSKVDSSSPPPVPDKSQSRALESAKSTRIASTSSIPASAAARLARNPSTSSSTATSIQHSPLQARRPPRSGTCPSSSRPALPHPALDPSQDHHRSDSGRSTGSSRSTATTDSFFLPQHPHAVNRRLKDLPAPPTSSRTIDAPASGLGLNVTIASPSVHSLLPSAQLFRSQSSVSTTPTSPEEGSGSPLGGSAALDFSPLEGDNSKLRVAQAHRLDDFWRSDDSYARPSIEFGQSTLPPLMRSDAAIPPSRSQSIDPFAEPLDLDQEADAAYRASQDDLTLHERSPPVGSATPLLAANLQKLNSQHDLSRTSISASSKLASPVLSSPSGLLTPTKRSDDGRLSVPIASPYQQPTTSASSSSSAVDRRSQLNKSSSSLSSSSAHANDKAALASASKRSSASSSSSFRMTLSRQAKTLRNSFMWTPPTNVSATTSKQGPASASTSLLGPDTFLTPTSQASSPSLAVSSPGSESSEIPSKHSSPYSEGGVAGGRQELRAFPAIPSARTSLQTKEAASMRSPHSATDAHSTPSRSNTARSDATVSSSAIEPSRPGSSMQKRPTDYSKLDERPRSRLSSRLTLQNASWSMKIPTLKVKKPSEATVYKSTAPHTTVEASSRTKSQASLSSTAASMSANALRAEVREASKGSHAVQMPKPSEKLLIDPTLRPTDEQSSVDSRLSPSFAATFAFLNSEIDSADQSPPLMSTVLPPTKDDSTAVQVIRRESAPAAVVRVERSSQVKGAARDSALGTGKGIVVAPTSQSSPSRQSDSEDAAARTALFDRLADSPEAVYKTLVLPVQTPLPASKSLDSVAAASSSKKQGHKKHLSLGSTTLISKSAQRAASDLDKRANGAPVASFGLPLTNASALSRSSFSNALPMFTPVSEETCFFDALTSPVNEQPSNANASPSPDDSVLPSFATATEFFPSTKTEPNSPVRQRSSTSAKEAALVAQASPVPTRSSLGRRLSGVFDTSKARSARQYTLASPPQSPRAEPMHMDALPARPETSLGFHLRNPLRRERKVSLKTAQPLAMTSTPSRPEAPSAASNKSTTSAIRKMSTGFRLDRSSPTKKQPARAETSLGMATSDVKTTRSISSRVLAPTKSSLARSVQPSPPSTGRTTVRSTSASSLATPTSKTPTRSPQRPANPPSSYRGSSAASALAEGSPGKPATLFKATPGLTMTTKESVASRQDTSVPAVSSQSASVASPPSPTDVRRRRALSKPALAPIRTSFTETRNFSRPSTATGFRGGMTAQDRKMSQPTLDMVDDREFLEALEQVRAVQRERIQAEAQEVENKTRLARLGMMSTNRAKTHKADSVLDDDESTDPQSISTSQDMQVATSAAAPEAVIPARPRLRHRRSASADAQLIRTVSTMSTASPESEREIDQRQKDIVKAYTDKKPLVGPPTTGLEWGVGKASGKLHDGAFTNDDDWKKEVKALFLIRELVQTERSYARHLTSLLGVIRKMQTTPNGGGSAHHLGIKRKSTSNLFAAYQSAVTSKTSANAAPPSHVALLRTYLPQLVALSNALIQRVEENPTSAGVGAAFDVLAAQLESTFVGWSGVAPQALAELRSTELAKSKSPFKIGLVPLMPRESTEVGASTADAASRSSSSGTSSPGSGLKTSGLRMTSLTRPPSPVAARQDANAVASSQADGDATVTAKRSTKRRSTITSTSFIAAPRGIFTSTSFIPPSRVVVAPPAVTLSSSPEEEKALQTDNLAPRSAAAASTPSRRFGHSRSQSTLVTPLATPTSSVAPDPWSAGTQAQQPSGGKSLTPMDIAIMPTQRLPRYGLMLRDLLRNTPPESLSHARVQRAIELIQKVALMCDAAAPMVVGGGGTGSGSVGIGGTSGAVTPAHAGSVLGMTSSETMVGGGGFGMSWR